MNYEYELPSKEIWDTTCFCELTDKKLNIDISVFAGIFELD